MTTLAQAQQWLREHVDDGVHCPCCTQFAKVYRRKLTGQTARALVLMYGHHLRAEDPDEYVYMPDLLGRKQADETKARYWGLIEEQPEQRDDGGRVGRWRLTNLGKSFVRGTVSIPKYARIYDGRCLSIQGDPITIHDALGTKFNYDELMAA